MFLNDYLIDLLMYIMNCFDIVFMYGKGLWFYDYMGKCYLDFIQGWVVNSFGYCNDGIVEVLKMQVDKLLNLLLVFYNELMVKFVGLFMQYSVFDKVFFMNSGVEVNEGVIKFVCKWGCKFKNGVYEIIMFDYSFYGCMFVMMLVSGKLGWDMIYVLQVLGFLKVELNNIVLVEKLIIDKIVVVMFELIQGEGGVILVMCEFMQVLCVLMKQYNLLLIVDEVQSGCGCVGMLFVYELFGIELDVMMFVKGIGGGVLFGVLLLKVDVVVFEVGDQGGMYNGNLLMMVVGYLVILQFVVFGFFEGVCVCSEYLKCKLFELLEECGFEGECGEGLLCVLLLGKDIGLQIVEKVCDMQFDGLLLNIVCLNLLCFMFVLNVMIEEIDQMMVMLWLIFDML